MLFLETVESEGSGIFPSCGSNLFFLRRLGGAFLGLCGAAGPAFSRGALDAPFGHEAGRQESVASQ
jgi:hypothetical protein